MSAGNITLNDIVSADWSLALDANTRDATSGSGIGQVVEGVADVNQCIGIILSTPKGSDPLRPTFAADIWALLDMPIDVARPQLVREIVEGITRWEPRVKLLSVAVNLVAGTLSQLQIDIVWRLAVDTVGVGNQQLTITVPQILV